MKPKPKHVRRKPVVEVLAPARTPPANKPNSESNPEEVIRPGWITKPEAMKLANRSLKRFEMLIRKYRVPVVYVRQIGRKPVPTYPEARIRELLRPVAVKDTKREIAPSGAIQALTDALRALRSPDTPTVPQLADKHLLTMAEAHALGWPRQVLRALKDSADPPGIRYGKRGFKFYASMLRDGKY